MSYLTLMIVSGEKGGYYIKQYAPFLSFDGTSISTFFQLASVTESK